MPLSGHAAARRPAVLSLPGATPLLLTAVAGRLGYGVLPVAVLLALARSTGSLALTTTLASVHTALTNFDEAVFCQNAIHLLP